jgi:hypothetical protein
MASNRGVIADAGPGDQVDLDRYLKTPVDVDRKPITADGVVLVLMSSGGSEYRLRAVDDSDDRLLLEKSADSDGWVSHLRTGAELTDDNEPSNP